MKIHQIILPLLLVSLFACNDAETENKKSNVTPPASGVYVVNHNDGDKVKSPVIIEMGVKGMEVEPAGPVTAGKGHHHIIIDGNFIEKDMMVPADEKNIHYGLGQTADTLTLSSGKHTITLQFANGMHQSYGKDWSSTITLDVE